MSFHHPDPNSPVNKVIFLQRILKFSCLKPKQAPLLATVSTLWQATLQDEWQTTALIFHNILKKDSRRNENESIGAEIHQSTALAAGRGGGVGVGFRVREQRTSSDGRPDLFKDLPESHPLELLFRRSLKERISWIVRAFVNGGHDVNSGRPAYGFSRPLWFCTVSRLDAPTVGRSDAADIKIERKIEVLRILATAGAEIDAVDGNGKTALFAAMEFCSPIEKVPLAKFFVEELGADVTKALNKKTGDTIMHVAIAAGDADLVEYLISYFAKKLLLLEEGGAKISPNDDDDCDAQHQQTKQSLSHSLLFLLNAADADGITPLMTICREDGTGQLAYGVLTGSNNNRNRSDDDDSCNDDNNNVPARRSVRFKILQSFFSTPRLGNLVEVEAVALNGQTALTFVLGNKTNRDAHLAEVDFEIAKFLITRGGAKTNSKDAPKLVDTLKNSSGFSPEQKKELLELM